MNTNPPPPPPPPPHGAKPPFPPSNEKYQVFVVPPESQGGGFIYFPSLRPQKNSFIAGALFMFVIIKVWEIVAPVLWKWTASVLNSGGAGVVALLVAVGLASWVIGRGGFDSSSTGIPNFGHSKDTSSPPPPGGMPHDHASGHEGMNGNAHSQSNGYADANGHAKPGAAPRPNSWGSPKPSSTFNARSPPQPQPQAQQSSTPQPGAWERAREETRKREEERRKAQAEAAAKAGAEKTRTEAREKEARERREREAKAKIERDAREAIAREKERERERANTTRYASTSVAGDSSNKFNPWARDDGVPIPKAAGAAGAAEGGRRSPSSPTKQEPNSQKRHQAYAKSFVSDDGAESTGQYSFRPYDRPKANSNLKKENTGGTRTATTGAAPSVFSEGGAGLGAEYGQSPSTAPTSPRGSLSGRGYATNDPDKIVIKAVYLFSNAYPKLPVAELVGGQANVSEGLVLSIGTEGLFIDDVVREVGQREWDVRAWTLKGVESGDDKLGKLTVLRAAIRDQEGKRYVFVMEDKENWKLALGLQKLKKGSLVRSMSVAGLKDHEVRALLNPLGWPR